MKMAINVNDGPSKSLEDFHKRSWTNVDITEFVKNSSTLTEEQYQGISDNVYNISITPIPNRIPQKPQRQREAVQASPQKVIASALQSGDEVDVYAILIVRRGPVK